MVHRLLHLAHILHLMIQLLIILELYGADNVGLQVVHGYLVLGRALNTLILLIEDYFVVRSDYLFELLLVVALRNLSSQFKLLIQLEQPLFFSFGQDFAGGFAG